MTTRRDGSIREGDEPAEAMVHVLLNRSHTRASPHAKGAPRKLHRASSMPGRTSIEEETFARQKQLGVVPENAMLTPRPAEIPAWDARPERRQARLSPPNGELLGFDELGGPTTEPRVPVGWAWAADTPFKWTKQVASHFGGTRNGLIIHWPKGIGTKGELRSQFHHVIDIAPRCSTPAHRAASSSTACRKSRSRA